MVELVSGRAPPPTQPQGRTMHDMDEGRKRVLTRVRRFPGSKDLLSTGFLVDTPGTPVMFETGPSSCTTMESNFCCVGGIAPVRQGLWTSQGNLGSEDLGSPGSNVLTIHVSISLFPLYKLDRQLSRCFRWILLQDAARFFPPPFSSCRGTGHREAEW